MNLSSDVLSKILFDRGTCGPKANVEDVIGRAYPVIDVRSPSEFERGHIPGAISVPLFNDSERAEIGTLYNRLDRESAVDLGLQLASGRAESLLAQVQDQVLGSEFIVHCWRGGLRSAGFAWLCRDCGLEPKPLEGGYKAFRRASHQSFTEPRKLIVLAGYSGSGKTRILNMLAEAGEQVIDLEGLARHRGSAFGGLGQPPQTSAEQFENELFVQWEAADPNRPLWIEGESRSIGQIQIPQRIWDQMVSPNRVFLEVDRESRIDFLVGDYGHLSTADLEWAIHKIRKRLGGLRLSAALAALQRRDLHSFCRLALEYYDKCYLKSLQKSPTCTVTRIRLARAADPAAVERLRQFASEDFVPGLPADSLEGSN